MSGTLDKRVGYVCAGCGQYVRAYCRNFNSNMGVALLMLYKYRHKGFVHLENLMSENGFKRCGDASYLKLYHLIEPLKQKREDGSKRNGFYRISGLGILFIEQKTKVQEKFIIYNSECLGFEGKEVDIIHVLGKKYNFEEMMQA